jgi:general secretion pathway protein G
MMISVNCGSAWKRKSSQELSAFTLVEILVVVAVIGILAGIVLAAAGGVQKKAARDQARAEIKTMLVALERYKADRMTYPVSTNSSRTALFTNLTNYMSFKTTKVTNNEVLDPYGNAYWYRSPAAASTTMLTDSCEVWSAGANRRSGFTNNPPNLTDTNNVDDITSWQ